MKKPTGKGLRAVFAQMWHWFGGIDGSRLEDADNLPIARVGGQTITPHSALTLSAVWACVGLISETIATLPLGFYQRQEKGRVLAKDHQLSMILGLQPNADMTAVQFWQSFVLSMLLWGNGYAEKKLSAGRVVSLELLIPDSISWVVNSRGELEYHYARFGKLRVIPESRMMHIPALSINGRTGLSPIKAGASIFGSAQAANSAATSNFQNGLHPTVAFKYPTLLREEQREEARGAIKKISGALNAGNPAILEAGMDAFEIGIDPKDAQLLESRNFSVEEIARWFRVPPFMIGHSEKSTSWGTGIEQQMIGFITFALKPWLSRIEQGISRSLLTPVERTKYYAEFALEGLLRGDSASRAAFYSAGLQNGWMNRDKVAELENQPKIPGGDVYTVQSNLIRLEDLGKEDPIDSALAKAVGDDADDDE